MATPQLPPESEGQPRQVTLELSPLVADWLLRAMATTGRTQNELLLELLVKGLHQP